MMQDAILILFIMSILSKQKMNLNKGDTINPMKMADLFAVNRKSVPAKLDLKGNPASLTIGDFKPKSPTPHSPATIRVFVRVLTLSIDASKTRSDPC